VTGFWIGAAVLCAVALAFLLWPLWRQRRESGRWSASAVVAAVLTVPLALALYLNVRTWQPEALQQRTEEAALVAQLAARMAQQPDDVDGWRLLGRSYVVLGEYGAASAAFAEAWRRMSSPDNELKLAYAESQVLADRSTLEGQAGDLIEQVLAEEPGNPKALWYGGQRALGLGDEGAARSRLTRLLALGPPEEIAQILRAQLAQLPTAEGSGEAVARSGAAPSSAADGPTIRVHVRLGQGVSGAELGADAALFIFARDPRGGPPVAVIREAASAVPGEFVLGDDNTMLPGRSLADFPELSLVARISPSGQPLEQPGDLYAELSYRAGSEESVELVIDKIVQ
jgi:cytochrome c-type biogenesis protein CcmH